ncbi:hypothetical protein [Vibrio mangrovi]|uniref:Uncharacterized protein n=1 Tax=Vibrio mangrovi TaxID=474394 RepID=A0A1Y6IX09_9VIBR|nr:hypothetical protein [Vibrio mangrovi]MDW6005384.1 hypothetical protein [Vibrio mangrovi]SMS02176.1 hypothetical protein VIM7927_03494 [Vibrio mangrovi]
MMSRLAKYLHVPEEYWEDVESWEVEENAESQIDMPYSSYLYVPEEAPDELLEIMGWSVGQCIDNIPAYVFDDEYDYGE